MSIETSVYLIDLNELQRWRESNRIDLCHEIESVFERSHEFDSDDPAYRDSDEPSVRQALRDFFSGRAFHSKYGHVYAQALRLLCRHYGTEIETYIHPDGDAAFRAAYVLNARFRIPDKFCNWAKEPLDFPKPLDLSIEHLRLDLAQQLCALLTPLNLERVNEGAAIEIKRLYGWLTKACEHHKDIVTFTYEV